MSYALLFRTHFWDDFNQRSFERVRKHAPGGDIFIAADETMGPVPCPPEYKLPHRVDQFRALGLPAYPEHATMWYNGDYPLYSAFLDLPPYDYYVMLEFDVVVHVDLQNVIEIMRARGGDVITTSQGPASPDWFWKGTAEGIYQDVYASMNPLIILSRRALSNLYYARLKQAHQFATGQIEQWPYCEAFIASQLKQADFQVHELSAYGHMSHFTWWPPVEESVALSQLSGDAFIHPVLTGDAYLRSLARYTSTGGPQAAVQREKPDWDAEFERLKQEQSRELQSA